MKKIITNQKGIHTMKKTKLLSLALALLMLFGMMLPTTMTAFAAGGTSTITVSGPENLALTASDFSAYKLFDVVKNGTSYAYTPVTAITAEDTGFLAVKTAYGTDLQTWLETNKADQEKMTQLTKDLMDFGFSPLLTAAQYNTTKVRFSGLDNGYYLVIGQDTSKDNSGPVIAHCTLMTVDEQDKDFPMTVKADAPTILKEASVDGGDTWTEEYYSTVPGNIVSFRLTTAVPNMEGYTSYDFIVHDIAIGMVYDEDSFIVTVGGTPLIAKDDDEHEFDFDYELVFDDDGCNYDFDIVFASDKFVDLTPGDEIVITYDGFLDKISYLDGKNFLAVNEAYVRYSNDPYTPYSCSASAISGVKNIIYGIMINKFDDNPGKGYENFASFDNALPGAEFKLWNGGETVKLVMDEQNCETLDAIMEELEYFEEGQHMHAYHYRLATDEEIASGTLGVDFTDTIVTPNSGTVVIMGLTIGTYSLEETKAPANFNKLTSMIEIELGYDEELEERTCLVDNVPINYCVEECEDLGGIQVLVGNHSGSMLPGTGGIGTTIFYIVGISLAISLAVAFVIRRKRNALNVLNAK